MIKKLPFAIFFSLLTNSFYSISQEIEKEKYNEGGMFFAIGGSNISGKYIDYYYKNKINLFYEFGPYNRIYRPQSNFIYKFEAPFRFFSNSYRFNDEVEGQVLQCMMGFSFKGIYSKKNDKKKQLELALGPGLYTVYQERISYPVDSDSKKIKDGFFAYTGISLEYDISYIIAVNNGHFGMATRFFLQPRFTLHCKKDVLRFFNYSYSIAWFYSFK